MPTRLIRTDTDDIVTFNPDGKASTAPTVEVIIKETRRGNLGVFKDSTADSGVRAMTDTEIEAHGFAEDLIKEVDADAYKSNDLVAKIAVPESDSPYVVYYNKPDT